MEVVSMTATLKDEVCGVDLGDQRLNKRLGKMIERLGASPSLGIPAATDGRAEMEAAYRFFDNAKVAPQKVLQPHIKATLERIAQCERVVLVQDTTELDLTRPSQQVVGAGPMDSEARRGAFLHPLVAFDSNGLPLGTAWHKTWAREKIETTMSDSERARKRQTIPIEEKESLRWIEGLRAARDVAAACPNTTCICVSDSESDIYEMFSEPRSNNTDGSAPELQLLVRACQTRSTETGNWLDDVRASGCLFCESVSVSARKAKIAVTKGKREQSRDARIADVEVRAATVTLCPPYRFDRRLPPITVNVVLVEEPHPPEGSEAIQWLLATTLPIDTPEAVQLIVTSYCLRWQIEVCQSDCTSSAGLYQLAV